MKRLLAVMLALALLLTCGAVAENTDYSNAKAYFATQNFDAALYSFRAAGSYGDAADYVEYINVIELGMGGLYAPAASTIANLYSKLDDAAEYQLYFTALANIEDGNLELARSLLVGLDGFFESDAMLDKIDALYHQQKVDAADASLAAGDWDAALSQYAELGDTAMIKETYYQKAEALCASGAFSDAADVYASIIGYKDAVDKLTRMQALEALVGEFSVGNTVTFGSYVKNGSIERTSDGSSWSGAKESLEWIVLAVEDGKALLITKDIIDSQIYASAGEPVSSGEDDTESDDSGSLTDTYGPFVTWYSSYLRAWLNSTFFNDAFNENERAHVLSTTITDQANPIYRSGVGSDTIDKVFILSMSELQTYLPENSDRLARVTQYASAMRGAGSNESGYGWYWVRNAGKSYFYAATCLRDGSIGATGYPCNSTYIGVRPVVWVSLY